jgi:hypothetical protein
LTDSKVGIPSRSLAKVVSADAVDDASESPWVSEGTLSEAVVESASERVCTAREVRCPVLRGYIESYLLMIPAVGDSWYAAAKRADRSVRSSVLAQVLRGVSYPGSKFDDTARQSVFTFLSILHCHWRPMLPTP